MTTTAVKTLVKMNLRSFKVNRAFGPAQYVKMQATFPEAEFLTIFFRFKKRKQNSSSNVPEVSRQSRAVDVKEMYEKRDARVELLF